MPETALITDLAAENTELRVRLAEAEDLLSAVRRGEIDALLMQSDGAPKVFTLQGVDAASNRARGEMLEIISDAVIALDADRRVSYLNPAARQLFSLEASAWLGQCVADVQELHAVNRLLAAKTMSSGDRRTETIEFGVGETRFLEVEIRLPVGREGAHRILVTCRDITERKQHEEHLQLLMREVNHRAKNLLGVVQAVAHQTAAARPEDFIERFGARIQALAANQDLLVNNNWAKVPLGDLVRSQLAPFGDLHGTRISISGPPVEVAASASQTLGMALHELATNALKYGALSNDVGRVEINWTVHSDGAGGSPRFAMCWVECGGPPVAKPSRRGFGWGVIGGMVKASLDCDAHIDFAPTGLVWRIDCPVDRVLEGRVTQSLPRPNGALAHAVTPATERKRVLVVEDEALIAMAIAAILSDAGFDVLGPASSVAQALALIARSGCDAAVLDTNLGAETAEPVALLLRSTQTPFVAVSGYSREQQPVALRDAPLLKKPLRSEQLIAEIERCFEASPG